MSIDGSNMFKPIRLSTPAPDGLSQILAAMEELDAPDNMPKGLTLPVWERFCVVRNTKIEYEQKVLQRKRHTYHPCAFILYSRDAIYLLILFPDSLCISLLIVLQIKVKGLELAEMQAFLERRINEDNVAQEEIKQHFEELRR